MLKIIRLSLAIFFILKIAEFNLFAQQSPYYHNNPELNIVHNIYSNPRNTPIVHRAGMVHEYIMFGYNPRFFPGDISFDIYNRPYVRVGVHGTIPTTIYDWWRTVAANTFIQVFNGPLLQWCEVDYLQAVQAYAQSVNSPWYNSIESGLTVDEHIVFDGDGDAYMLVGGSLSTEVLLLYLHQGNYNWSVYELPRRTNSNDGGLAPSYHLERNLQNNITGNPPAYIYTDRQTDELFLMLSTKIAGGGLTFQASVRLVIETGDIFLHGSEAHSGRGSSTVTFGDVVYIVYSVNRNHGAIPGTPHYALKYDVATGIITGPQYLGSTLNAPPDVQNPNAPDPHNLPSIVADNKGGLHVVLGGHSRPLIYRECVDPINYFTTWSNAESFGKTVDYNSPNPTTEPGPWETYPGLVIDAQNTLHLVARVKDLNKGDCLHYMRRKNTDNAWQDIGYLVLPYIWKPNEVYHPSALEIADSNSRYFNFTREHYEPAGNQYSGYYHKISIDKIGRLFVYYSYLSQVPLDLDQNNIEDATWPIPPAYTVSNPWIPTKEPVLLMSDDHGDTWRIAVTDDLLNGVADWNTIPRAPVFNNGHISYRSMHYDVSHK